MSSLAELESELAQRQDDLNTCNEMLALDPTSADALETIPILDADIADLKAQIAARKNEAAAVPPPPADAASPPKYDMSKHPKFQNAASATPPPPPLPAEESHAVVVFNAKDSVMAKWSEDKQWYAATVVSRYGSSTDPVYKVTFKGYGNTETKRKHEVRAVVENHHHANNKKRKADGTSAAAAATAPPPPPPPPSSTAPPQQTSPTIPQPSTPNPQPTQHTGTVISAAPTADPSIPLPKKREPSKVSDGPTRLPPEPKKLKGNKVLDKQKSSWQDFQKSGPKKQVGGTAAKKMLGKESQFRTPDLPGAKVGFTGSGKPMSKDQARKTWKYGGSGGEMDED